MSKTNKIDKNAKEFNKTLNQMAIILDSDIELFIRRVILNVFIEIIKRSPVDTGAYRASHGIATEEPDDNQDIHPGFSGTPKNNAIQALQYVQNKIKGWRWYINQGKIIIFNNLPYAGVLEEGGYPKNPKRGSWNPKTKQYEIRSAGGFSKQAPKGIYTITIAEFNKYYQQELQKWENLKG